MFRRKRPRSPKGFQLQDAWAVRNGVADGRPIVLRIHRGVDRAIRHPDFPHQLRVAKRLRAACDNGLPSPAEHRELMRLERRITDLLGGDQHAIHVATVTTGGRCEFVFYTGDPKRSRDRLSPLLDARRRSDVRSRTCYDPDWSAYDKLAHGG